MRAIDTNHNKQRILNRMLDLAATIHGVSKSELLDPVVILLIESLAEEIYHLSSEIDNLEARVLNRLSSLLVSETAAIACPAHSLLHVLPGEYKLELTTTDPFTLEEPKKEKDKLSLYPVCNTPVYRGGIRYFVFDRFLFSIDRELTKTLISRSGSKRNESAEPVSFWIGLELDDGIENLENLSFYMDFSEGYNSTDNLRQLTRSKWKLGGQEVRIRKGLFSTDESLNNPALNLFRRSDNTYKINSVIKKMYDGNYITIDQPLDITCLKELFPASLKSCFREKIQSDFTKEMLWFEITTPSNFTEEMMRAIEISINIVPVSYKRLAKEMLQVNKHIPVIPLNTRTNEYFLSVHSMSDSSGINYYDIPLSDSGEERYGIYALRSGGYERFGRNDAKEFLSNMTNLIDREAASLFKKNNESKAEQTVMQERLTALIRNLNQVIHSEKEHAEVKNYLIVEQQSETEIYFLKYWIAGSLMGETIKVNTPVRPSLGYPVNPSGVYLIKTLSGGRRTPSQHEKYNLYKKSLAEHPLLITPDDICNFCLKEFSEIVEKVKVGSGYKKSKKYGTEYIKTTDVYLYIRESGKNKADKNIPQHIEQMLMDHSPATFNYRVILNNSPLNFKL